MEFSLRFHAHSEVGRVRKNNQDSGYASPNLLLVADGMGGAAAGDLASAVAITEAARADVRMASEELVPALAGVVRRTTDKLAALVMADPSLDGMGTTFCGAAFSGSTLGLVHIGDSRCYRLRDGTLTQLTHDHSWVQSLIDEGRLTPEQAANHPHRSLILKVLNGQPSMIPDYDTLRVSLGDRYLFCSDGLSGLVDEEGIRRIMAIPDISVSCDALAEAANLAGGHDNITVVIGEVVEHDPALDAAPAELVGSALEREIPSTTPSATPGGGDATTAPPPVTAPAAGATPVPDSDPERARYEPQGRNHRRWPAITAGLLAILLIVGGATWGVVSYGQSRYFLADADGRVGIYNGLPGALLGHQLNTVVELSNVATADLPKFYQRAVQNTIGVASLEEAHATAARLRVLAEKCVAVREERLNRPTPSPRPTPSGLTTIPPDYPTYLAPITPTVSNEADPESC